MTRIESIIALLKANTGASTVAPTTVATYANLAETITLETISSGIMATSPLKGAFDGLPTADLLDQMFISLFGYTQAEMDALKATEAGAAGYQYWINELANNSDMINVNTLAIALLNGASAEDSAKASALVADEVAAYEIFAGNPETPVETDGQTVYLTANQDILTGTDGNDTFIARGNNTLTNADIIDGGKGTDTVFVMLDNKETAESPLLTNVEILKVQAQATTSDSGDSDVDAQKYESNIDAGDMKSVTTYINDNSRADLTIEDVSRNSHITTLVMRETNMGDVDYNVFFDPENITAPGTADQGATLLIKLANVLNIAEGNNPVDKFESISFNVGATTVTVDISTATSYDAVVTAIQAAIDASGIIGLTVAKQSAAPAYFSIDVASYAAGQLAGSYNPILITNNASGVLTPGQIELANNTTNANMTNTMTNVEGSTVPSLTQTNVVFDRVGKDSKGGDFLAGSESTGDYSGSKGIEQFDVTVERTSWLNSIASTNNTLEVINVENGTGFTGNLKVDSITDVRVIDASAMVGSANITATLSEKVVEKYLNLTDTQSNPAADNSDKAFLNVVDTYFSYDFGSNNDTFDLTISNANLAAAGTTTREDFVMEINGNGGNDTITTIIGDGTGIDTDAWYINSKINSNLVINAGSGNDTVTTKGAGNFKINLGEGNDTVYTDNTGAQAGITTNDGKAVWVLNSVDRDIEDLTSEAAESITGVNLQVTVSFNGFEKTVTVADSVGATTTKTITDLQINQAIKDAINNDDVLSKLLVAQDGPSRSLIIESLIDGVQTTTDLTYTFTNTALTTAQTTAGLVGADLANTANFANGDYDKAINAATNAINATEGVLEVLEVQTIDLTGGFAAISDGDTVSLLGDTHTLAGGDKTGFATADDAGFAAYVAANISASGWTVTANGAVLTLTQTATNGSNAATQILGADNASNITVFVAAAETVTDGVVGGATAIVGADSTAVSDNIITAGTGNDVIVLGTDSTDAGTGASNDTIVFKGYDLGNDTIVNFIDGASTVAGYDILDFTEYLDGAAVGAASAAIAGTVLDKTVLTLSHNETVGTSVDFDALTDTLVQALLNGTGTATDAPTILSTINGSATAVTNNILMIENAQNLGEYKIFDLNSTATSTDFTVELIGTVDFGASQVLTADNLA